MAQHFLFSAASRPLPVARVLRMHEDTAYAEFRRARWPGTGGKPDHCPRCGSVGAGVRFYETVRRRFRYSACCGDFTVTSGTAFASLTKLGIIGRIMHRQHAGSRQPTLRRLLPTSLAENGSGVR